MDISIKYISLKYYKKSSKRYWLFYFYKFKYIFGFNIRLFGFHLTIKESNSLSKILAKLHGIKNDSNI